MRENVDLEREILLYLEENDNNNEGFEKYEFLDFIKNSSFSEFYVLKHCRLLEERGLIKLFVQPADNNPFYYCHIGPITAKGYEFIDSTRSNKLWEDIKYKLKDKGLDITLAMIVEYLSLLNR